MTEQEIFNCEILQEIQDISTKLYLLTQKISAKNPTTTRAKPKGYTINPATGEKEWYDKALKRQYEKNRLTLIEKETA